MFDPLRTVEFETASDSVDDGAPAPGTDVEDVQTPPAEAKTTDTSGPPESVPYARFKEVNDQLREFKELQEATGYDVDSLRQLAEWDQSFAQDRVGTFLQIGEALELPDDLKEAIARHREGGESPKDNEKPDQKQEGSLSDEEPPTWAKPLVDDYKERTAEAERSAQQEVLDSILESWDKLDEEQEIPEEEQLTESEKLTFLIAHSQRGTSQDKIVSTARGEWLSQRERAQKGTVRRPDEKTPRSVPGSGAPPQGEKQVPKTLSEATELARAALLSGGDFKE
jgi:hypothetical protein